MLIPASDPVAVLSISLALPAWVDLGVLGRSCASYRVAAGETVFVLASGVGSVFTGAATVPATPAGTTPATGFIGTAFSYGYYAASWSAPADPVDASVYCLAVVAQAVPLDPSARYVQPTTQRRIFCPGNAAYYQFTNGQPDPVALFAQFNGIGFFYGDYTGAFSVAVYPLDTFPRGDGGDGGPDQGGRRCPPCVVTTRGAMPGNFTTPAAPASSWVTRKRCKCK